MYTYMYNTARYNITGKTERRGRKKRGVGGGRVGGRRRSVEEEEEEECAWHRQTLAREIKQHSSEVVEVRLFRV
jgi:hypothetical protein